MGQWNPSSKPSSHRLRRRSTINRSRRSPGGLLPIRSSLTREPAIWASRNFEPLLIQKLSPLSAEGVTTSCGIIRKKRFLVLNISGKMTNADCNTPDRSARKPYLQRSYQLGCWLIVDMLQVRETLSGLPTHGAWRLSPGSSWANSAATTPAHCGACRDFGASSTPNLHSSPQLGDNYAGKAQRKR